MGQRVFGLDLLRCIAVIAVVLYHYPKGEHQLWLRALSHYGWAGVDLFFVLSGYLIAGQLFSRIERGQPFGLRQFYLRRFLRTLPNYFVILAVYVALAHWQGTAFQGLWKYFFFTQNFSSIPNFSQSWSLCVEEQFYLVFPLLVYAMRRRGPGLFVSILVFGAVLRFWVWREYRPDLVHAVDVDRSFELYLGKLFYPTYARLDGLTIGVALAALSVFKRDVWASWMKMGNFFLVLGGALLAGAAVALHWRMSFFSVVFGFPLLAFGFGALLVALVGPTSVLSHMRIAGVSQVALLSYAIYLTHGLALGLAAWICLRIGAGPHGWAMAAISLGTVSVTALTLYHGVERVFMRIRDRVV